MNHRRRHPSSSCINEIKATHSSSSWMALAPSHRIASHESHVQIYGVVSTAPPEFPPPKLKKARVGATVLVRRLVETVGRVVTLVPVANADIVIAIMMDGTYRTLRPSVRHCGDRIEKTTHFFHTPRTRQTAKVPERRVKSVDRGKERKKRQRFVYTESTVHDSTDQTICRQEAAHNLPSFSFSFSSSKERGVPRTC
jgi:hypothetical protein